MNPRGCWRRVPCHGTVSQPCVCSVSLCVCRGWACLSLLITFTDSVDSSPSFRFFSPLPSLSCCPLIGFVLSGVETNTKCHYLLSLCGTHVISSEPHGAMVSIHVSGFFPLLKLEFLSGVPISGTEESGLACANQKKIADTL